MSSLEFNVGSLLCSEMFFFEGFGCLFSPKTITFEPKCDLDTILAYLDRAWGRVPSLDNVVSFRKKHIVVSLSFPDVKL